VIGAANGSAVGGGFELLLACDLVVASEDARFGLPEVKRGLFAASGGVVELVRRIPPVLAAEMVLTGDYVDAARAREIGLVNVVVPADRVLDAALELASRVSVNGPLAVMASKRIMRTSFDVGRDAAYELQEELRHGVFGSEDAKEGAAAFVERRSPVWKGR
jgi:enoyl-CoA hydratase